ncbi:hypothetical protein LEN26_012860 [Aphanomyces euteiches]|nr:hypothetical protein LEN26_012860 [Aphanomyces euteiches]KAH9188138.1 hypothetical protein AeNC1_009889 [Aphanomyces euteiches]
MERRSHDGIVKHRTAFFVLLEEHQNCSALTEMQERIVVASSPIQNTFGVCGNLENDPFSNLRAKRKAPNIMPTDKEAHKDAVTCLYKLHAALQDDLNEMQDPSTSMKGNSSVWVLCRYGLLATKEAEATKLKQHITIQSEQHEQAKRGWEDEERSLRETIVSLKLLVEEKEGFADETKRQLMAAEQENAVLRETSKEREKFISTMLAENEKTLKLHVNGTNEAALIMDVDQTQHKATHENIEQLRLTAKYLDSYSSDISQAINECGNLII